ncbi:MAG: tetratricopeptide repeat protein [Thermodesulfobacteriota bacterium]
MTEDILTPAPAPDIGPDEPVSGVFSTEVMATIGAGTTKRRAPQKIYMFVEDLGDGQVTVQPVNKNFVPSGKKTVLTREKLLKDYLPEPSVYMHSVSPAMRALEAAADRGDQHREKDELFSAEFEYKNALRVDEEHVRSTFGLGLTYLKRSELRSAEAVFKRIVTLESAFEVRHKHLFNDFGIQLRRNGLFAQAMEYYGRAIQLTGQDENLFFNLARAAYESGRLREAREHAEKALALNPGLAEARKLLVAVCKAIETKKIVL